MDRELRDQDDDVLAELRAAPSALVTVPGAVHSFEPRSKAARERAEEVAAVVASAGADWIVTSLSR
ncbi:MAG: hypothetical protein ACQERF_02775 [Actinomycetota bacterium]